MARRVTRNYRADEITEEQWEELIVDSDSDENVDPEVSVFEPRDEISESDVYLWSKSGVREIRPTEPSCIILQALHQDFTMQKTTI